KSPDNSGAICDELALLDSRIRVIHNAENQGACLARKTGLKLRKKKSAKISRIFSFFRSI
ncbi:MAG: glycosyltransferase, partial [Helicobacteraceae bacterium]|nr:glycosyltransferase [Helicobacteraceae bacterium]